MTTGRLPRPAGLGTRRRVPAVVVPGAPAASAADLSTFHRDWALTRQFNPCRPCRTRLRDGAIRARDGVVSRLEQGGLMRTTRRNLALVSAVLSVALVLGSSEPAFAVDATGAPCSSSPRRPCPEPPTCRACREPSAHRCPRRPRSSRAGRSTRSRIRSNKMPGGRRYRRAKPRGSTGRCSMRSRPTRRRRPRRRS